LPRRCAPRNDSESRHGRRTTVHRSKEADPPRRPEPSWLVGAMIGMTISTLAAGAIMLGAGLAVGQVSTRGK
jgi:hypothetical protein